MSQLKLDFSLGCATRGDVDWLCAVAFESWNAQIRPLVGEDPGLASRERTRFARWLDANLNRVIVARSGDEILGWVGRGQSSSYVSFLFVAPGIERRGVGRALIERVESLAVLEGASLVWLDTFAHHDVALKFYGRLGYQPVRPQDRVRIARHASSGVRLAKSLSFISALNSASGDKS